MTHMETTLFREKRAPLCIVRQAKAPPLHEYVAECRHYLMNKLLDHGAILFRNFAIEDTDAFAKFIAATGDVSVEYQLKSTPRTAVTGNIYTSTEYPSNREIPLHNENAYLKDWPARLAFCCIQPASEGGDTPLADMRDVVGSIGPTLMDRFEESGVRYLRHYHRGIDLPWTDVFQTSSPSELERICSAHDIRHEWIGKQGDILRTINICQGTTRHPKTGERVFFNQAHLFHVTSMGPEIAQSLCDTFGSDQLPRHSTFGDTTEIPGENIHKIHTAFRQHAVTFKWQRGDVLWFDNIQIAHGRTAYRGQRRILAALMNPMKTEAPTDDRNVS
jgi:alpha-ketoglutarate-dependent taurine dioxygenase